ncbi:Zinc finger protein 354A [Frankliniella fusca]|uniref:Zinc finger protein 354A n=1 Tax=Frankliniella fusca TaxID=407009 RepID=A0AAE1GYA1_9NEOP|nr:Zinc finger protein 354A [Frankliniella fusca]
MALDVQISYSWTNYCRLCLEDNGIMLPLFEGEGHHRKLSHKIETCLQIVTYDGDPLPRRICHTCLYKVNQLYEFRSMVWASYERLKLKLLPLHHVPEVQTYLEKANNLQKTLDQSSLQLSNCSTPIPSSSNNNESKRLPMIRVKSEEELMQAPDCSSWPTSTPFSHVDSAVIEPYLSSSSFISSSITSDINIPAMESALPPDTQTNFVGVQPETLKRKRIYGASDYKSDKAASPVCKKLKTKKKQLAGPLSRKLNRRREWRCVFCQMLCTSKQALNNHLEKCLKCLLCKKEFPSVAEKSIHEAEEHLSVFIDCNQKHLSEHCSQCPAQFASRVMLSMHIGSEHASLDSSSAHFSGNSSNVKSSHFSQLSLEKDGKSELDQKDSSDSEDQPLSTLKECKKTNPVVPNEDYSCILCNATCDSAINLQDHMKALHGRFKCTLCPQSFASKHGLASHQKYHVYRSRQSKKLKEKSDSILKDILSVSKKKAFKCNICFEDFEEEDAFILHLYVHATEFSDDESMPVKKDRRSSGVCKKSEPASSTEEPDNSIEQFSVKCERCHVVCRSKEYYQIHLATHMSKVRTNFPCSGCNQDFRNVEALNRHTCCGKLENMQVCCLDCGQALVEGADHVCDNKCPVCEKVFKSARGQRLHFVSKHKSKTLEEDGYFGPQSLTDDELHQEENENSPVQDEQPISQSMNECSTANSSGNVEGLQQSSVCESPDSQSRRNVSPFGKLSSASHVSEDELSHVSGSDEDSENLPEISPLRERLPPDGAPVEPLSTSLDPIGKVNPISPVCDNLSNDPVNLSKDPFIPDSSNCGILSNSH